jgi:hypothetical protein
MQQVNSTPLLQSVNKFACLAEESINVNNTSDAAPEPVKDVQITPKPTPHCQVPKWEHRLPKRYVVASTPSPKSLHLKVELQTTDTREVLATNALLDCRATSLFINTEYVKQKRLTVQNLARPIPVYNVNGTLNEAGEISGIVDVVLWYKGHTERAQFVVTGLGKQDLILGYTWLCEHNPEVDWQTNTVKISCCPAKCHTCTKEVRQKSEKSNRKLVVLKLVALDQFLQWTTICMTSQTSHQTRMTLTVMTRAPGVDDKSIEEGDRIFATCFHNEPAEVHATQNISQQLAEAFHKNLETKSFRDSAPDYLHDFKDVFSKTSFDELPAQKPWDHAIELIPDAQNKSRKVYPLSILEQEQLDKFLKENLMLARICPSKSPMAAPFFFVKKKDGSLYPVQNYRALNVMTVKNKYPLPLILDLINQLHGAKYFTKLDVHWGYNNIRIKEGDEWKAATWTGTEA